MRLKIFTEIGVGNPSFISTEIEFPDGSEKRLPGFHRMYIQGVYVHCWIGRRVLIFSSTDGIKRVTKDRSGFKLVLGLQGLQFCMK